MTRIQDSDNPLIYLTPVLPDRLRMALRFDGFMTNKAQTARLAQLANVQKRTAQRWLSGSTSARMDCIMRLAESLNVDSSWLLFGEFILRGPDVPDRHALIAGMPQWKITIIHHAMNRMSEEQKDVLLQRVERIARANPARALPTARIIAFRHSDGCHG